MKQRAWVRQRFRLAPYIRASARASEGETVHVHASAGVTYVEPADAHDLRHRLDHLTPVGSVEDAMVVRGRDRHGPPASTTRDIRQAGQICRSPGRNAWGPELVALAMERHPVLDERAQLCDLFEELGPDAPTLCDGWTTRDLAAHLWTREHRLDAGPGLVTDGAFARHTQRVEAKTASRPYHQIVDALRSGPTWFWPGRWLPAFDVHEWFVHHEDVRRPNGGSPRDLGELDAAVWHSLDRWGKVLTKSLEVGVELETPDGRRRTAREGVPAIVLRGAPGELLLRLFGRPSEVEVRGAPDVTRAFESSSLGF